MVVRGDYDFITGLEVEPRLTIVLVLSLVLRVNAISSLSTLSSAAAFTRARSAIGSYFRRFWNAGLRLEIPEKFQVTVQHAT